MSRILAASPGVLALCLGCVAVKPRITTCLVPRRSLPLGAAAKTVAGSACRTLSLDYALGPVDRICGTGEPQRSRLGLCARSGSALSAYRALGGRPECKLLRLDHG